MVPEVAEESSANVIVGRDAQIDILETLLEVCIQETWETTGITNGRYSHLFPLRRSSSSMDLRPLERHW